MQREPLPSLLGLVALTLAAFSAPGPTMAQNRTCDPDTSERTFQNFEAALAVGDQAQIEQRLREFVPQLYANCRAGDVLLTRRANLGIRIYFCDFTRPVVVGDVSMCILVGRQR